MVNEPSFFRKMAIDARYYTRHRRTLWVGALGILSLGTLVAFLLGQRPDPSSASVRGRLEEAAYRGPAGAGRSELVALWAEALNEWRYELWDFLAAIPVLASALPESDWGAVAGALDDRFGTEASALALDYFEASFDEVPAARERLEMKAGSEPPTRFANRILGELSLARNLGMEAARYFAREGAFAEAVEERRQAIALYQELGAWKRIRSLAAEPRFRDAIGHEARLRLAVEDRDWLVASRYEFLWRFTDLKPGILLIAGIGGGVWAIILAQLGLGSGSGARLPILCAAAFVLGALSVVPTAVSNAMLQSYFNVAQTGDFLRDLAFFVVSVGGREELCKLLLFLPLVPLLIRRGEELEMLIVAGFVGLGFAVAENFGYLEVSAGSAAPARFLTANFFHVGLTGLCGLYLCRAFAIRGYDFAHFLYVLGSAILAHGLYNALLALPELAEFSFLGYSVYILLALRFFEEAHALLGPARPTVSFSAVFAAGICVLVVAALIYMTRLVGFRDAFNAIGPATLSVGLIAVMFFRAFREELHS